MTSTLPPLVQAISGAIGSASANTLTYPLDLVTTRVQLASPPRAQGSSSKGKERDLHPMSESKPDKLQSEREHGLKRPFIFNKLRAVRILRSIIHSHGVGALYDGLLTDTMGTLVSNFFYFYIYSFLRKLLIRYLTGAQSSSQISATSSKKPVPSVKLAAWQELILGFLSGVTSRAVSMPLSIITLRLQTERQNRDDESSSEDSEAEEENGSNGLAQVVKKIYEEQGLGGFWRGFNTTILLSLNPSITMAFFQMFRRVLALSRHPRQAAGRVLDPTPMEAFFGGAISNSFAVAILYPLILSKTRLQASRKSSSTLPQSPTLRTVMLDAYYGRYPHHGSHPASKSDSRVAGIKGLYQGLDMQILKGFFNQGVTFLVKGRIEQLIVQAYVQRRLGVSNAGTGLSLPMPLSMPLDSDDPNRSLEAWNIVEHVGRRYL
ncbi:mitochondrial carrier [Gymnopus androsaceus JB14]|uniref:Mitochondrial carrier n=1 Tax=Gymnopus androsaceus JB14 TaxID=1447944 RepID=A0A6A4HZA2_9AGAR|nr:mitochondrial carrier [Gymnopus androsaceus JB14]